MTITFRRTRALQLAAVVLIAIVVAGVMLSSSFGIRDGARDASAQALARNALMIQRSHYYGSGEYADAETLRNSEPKVDATDEVAVLGSVYVRSEAYSTTLSASTKDGTCYWIRDTAGAATYATTPCTEEPGDADFAAAW